MDITNNTFMINIINNINNENIQLKNDNELLKKQRDELYAQHSNNYILLKQKEDEINILKSQNETLLREIDFIKKENAELKLKITQLEETILEHANQIKSLQTENAIIKQENAIIKQENAEIKQENAEIKQENIKLNIKITVLEEKINLYENKDLTNKFILAIQDLNSIYEFEKNIKKTKLSRLRKQRNDTCHYLCNEDDEFITLKKKQTIIEKLCLINIDVKTRIETLYGNDIITKIIDYMKPILENETKIMTNNDEYTEDDINYYVSYFW